MRVVRAAGQNVSPSDDGRLYAQIFSDGLFTDTTFTNLGGNNVQVGAMYGDLCGRDFTIEQMTMTVILPEGEGETTGYIYVEIDTSSDDVISLNSALAPFTPTYEDINTNGAVAQMIIAEYTATAVAVTGVTAVYEKAAASSVKAGSIATVESAQATENHSAGDYILLNGQMYLVTASVSVGETFVEGTNITSVSIGEELTALNAGLPAYTLLWTNQTLNATFVPTTIPVDLTNYNFIGISVGDVASANPYISSIQIIEKNQKAFVRGGASRSRLIQGSSNSGVQFGTGTDGTNDNNTYCIPYRIYGVK